MYNKKSDIRSAITNNQIAQPMTIREAVDTYSSIFYNSDKHYRFHDFAHLISAGWTNPTMMMDYNNAKKIKPLYQAGLESEYIAGIYQRIFGEFGINEDFCPLDTSSSEYKEKLESIARITQKSVSFENSMLLDGLKNSSTEQLEAENSNKNHIHGMVNYLTKYLQSGQIALLPTVDELIWHANKAVELCMQIHDKYGKYLSEMNEVEIMSLPIDYCKLDNISPLDISEQNLRTHLYRDFYKNSTNNYKHQHLY